MTADLVPFSCPVHGHILDTYASAEVVCGKFRCGKKGVLPEHVRATQKRRSQARAKAVSPPLSESA